MPSPAWLRVGTDLVDESGDEWLIRGVEPDRVTLQHPDRGIHQVLREDLVAWVEDGRWTVLE